jgi:hypothetical protein
MPHHKVGHFFCLYPDTRINDVCDYDAIVCYLSLIEVKYRIQESKKRPKSEFIDLNLNPARSFFV